MVQRPTVSQGSSFVVVAVILLWSSFFIVAERLDGRYSFSLTTFDPDGKLGQVERATRAASLGTPVAALKGPDGILFAAPQALPSPLVRDDGTARFCRVTRNIAIAHSGLGADGRAVVAASQRMAVEHAYTFDETIPIELFLEEVSLLFQEHTMKPAARPFGCSLLVAYVPDHDETPAEKVEPELYRIEPSGSVESIQNSVAIGSLTSGVFASSLKDMSMQGPVEEGRTKIIKLLKSHLQKKKDELQSDAKLPFLTATLTAADGLVVWRHLGVEESTEADEPSV